MIEICLRNAVIRFIYFKPPLAYDVVRGIFCELGPHRLN